MEVFRNHYPKNNFLEKVRKIANENGIVLVFDECTSGLEKLTEEFIKNLM